MTITLVLSGCSVFVGAAALIAEKFIFPMILDNYVKTYAPLPYYKMIQSFVEFILIIVCYKCIKKEKKILFFISEVMVVFALFLTHVIYRFSYSGKNIADKINYEYRQLYGVISNIVSTSEYYLNFISLFLLILVSIILIVKKVKTKKKL